MSFPLLSDRDGRVASAFGVLGAQGAARRTTFVIGPDGVIRHVEAGADALDPGDLVAVCPASPPTTATP